MRKNILLLILSSLLLLATVGYGESINLYSLFPNLTLGSDPEGALDTVYVTCGTLTATEMTLQIRLKTDNTNTSDANYDYGVVAFYIPIEITTDAPGVTLDSSEASVFSGSDFSPLGLGGVSIIGGDPSTFPMQMTIGGVRANLTGGVGPGDFLVATLRFNLSQPTNICVPNWFSYYLGDLLLVTEEAIGYTPAFIPACCGPIVPTLTEWGLIIFGVLLLGGLIWYLRRRRATRLA